LSNSFLDYGTGCQLMECIYSSSGFVIFPYPPFSFSQTGMDSTNVYAYISIIALLVCIPPAVLASILATMTRCNFDISFVGQLTVGLF
jgi:hypothetical protein